MWFPGTFSTIKIIKKLLPQIVVKAKRMNLRSVAIPLLGTGVGRLNPNKIMDLYEMNFKNNEDVDIYVYLLKQNCHNKGN